MKWILVKLRKSNLTDEVQIKTKCIPFYRISQTHPDNRSFFIIYYIHVRGVTWLAMSDLPGSFDNWKLRVTKYFTFFTFLRSDWCLFVWFFFYKSLLAKSLMPSPVRNAARSHCLFTFIEVRTVQLFFCFQFKFKVNQPHRRFGFTRKITLTPAESTVLLISFANITTLPQS